MPDIDFFNFFRWMLGGIATIYAGVITWQSLWGWYVWLAGGDKYIGILRRYLVGHGLRLRFATFWGDVILCILLTIAFFILMHAHRVIYDLGASLDDQRAPTVDVRHLRFVTVTCNDLKHVEQSIQS